MSKVFITGTTGHVGRVLYEYLSVHFEVMSINRNQIYNENIFSYDNLFDYLKTQFAFMLVISHIDSMRDVVDRLIEITKTNGSSKIQYSYT